jgi:hypothetical protein
MNDKKLHDAVRRVDPETSPRRSNVRAICADCKACVMWSSRTLSPSSNKAASRATAQCALGSHAVESARIDCESVYFGGLQCIMSNGDCERCSKDDERVKGKAAKTYEYSGERRGK